ncbi:hypothetical protein [Luteibacter sp. 22Crub2.1]|nr:hypothetical protein [Luteibacter sp. 22Crub2.1]SKB50206.1 hypothetical protein SAMN05660880_01340 [Luteibacter sp. 22Crub2.1]
MSIQYNSRLKTHTAVDQYGVVLAIYDPATHGTLADFCASSSSLVSEG